MEEFNHPLGMTVLEIQDTVTGYESLNEDVISRLMAADDFRTLPPNLQKRVLGITIPSPFSLVAEVDGAAVLVTNRWVVSIHGDNLAHCVAVLVKYRNAVATELAAVVSGTLYTPVVENTGPLRELVERRERQSRFKGKVSKAGWTLAGALIGFALGSVGNLLISFLRGG